MEKIINKTQASFSPSGVTFYNTFNISSAFTGSSSMEFFSGKVTPKSISKKSKKPSPKTKKESRTFRLNKGLIRRKADVFTSLPSSRKFTAFYSISFPQHLPDKSAIKVLNIWLTRLRALRPRMHYIWISERQGNGTIHFHLLTDTFFNIRVVNYYMAKALDGLRNKHKEVFEGWNRNRYNGVDVKRVFNRKGVIRYLNKYMTKGNDEFSCRSCGFDRCVSALFTKVNMSRNEAISYCDYFLRPDDESPFAYACEVSEFAVWIPLEHGIPPDLMKRLNQINLQVFEMFNN